MQSSTTVSKSQKRKNRIARKAIEQAKPKVTVKVTNSRSSSNRRRSRRNKGSTRNRQSRGILSYDRALLDPENAEGAKVPDMIAYPTGTFQLVSYNNLALGAGGDSFGIQFYPIIGDGSSAYPFAMYSGTTSGSLATRAPFSWNERSAVTALYSLFRPVSACVDIFYTGTASAESGEMTGGCTWYSSVGTLPTTYSQWGSLPEMRVFDVEGHTKVLWKPLDNSHLSFQPVTGPAGTGGSPIYPQILLAFSGLQAGSTAHATVTCNFEAIPDSAQGNLVETEASPYDPVSLRKAWEWAQSNADNIFHGIQYAGKVADAIGYNPLKNWNPFQLSGSRNPQIRRVRGGNMAVASMMSHVSKDLVHVQKDGKEEDDDFTVAERKFNEMLVSETKSSSELPNKTIAISKVTPVSSPSLMRRFGGQV